ncbi:MAG: AMP-binding protein [Candidatus Lambdaproteobacteria bacterium]|nr:AMP-binding protein [Candidatus Lambdaproteobacteria bacterium]
MTSTRDAPGRIGLVDELSGTASALTIGDLLRLQTRARPAQCAVEDDSGRWTFAQLNERTNRLCHVLGELGIGRGDRVAMFSENRHEYLEVEFACAKLGAITCGINWRLADPELVHCITLTTPKIMLVSERYREVAARIPHGVPTTIQLDAEYERALAQADPAEPRGMAQPEDGLLILYTSGTTGLPKGALISQRAQVARMQIACIDFALRPGDSYVAWSPMFHMSASDQSLHTVCMGGKAVLVDGADIPRIVALAYAEPQWWLMLLPGMIDRVVHEVQRRSGPPKGVRLVGSSADMMPRTMIRDTSRAFNAPFLNVFGSTETGLPPASKGRFAVGVAPESLAKDVCSMCDYRLVDAHDVDVPEGEPGELVYRGPALFSGYWNNREANLAAFRNGWYHMGDMFARQPDGRINFMDRVKYLIKSGGENIYPAEIERVLLSDTRVDDAVVVRKPDDRWGEIPVAFVARNDESLTPQVIEEMCRAALARYKRPKEIHLVAFEDFPRNTTGKILRQEVEKWVKR